MKTKRDASARKASRSWYCQRETQSITSLRHAEQGPWSAERTRELEWVIHRRVEPLEGLRNFPRHSRRSHTRPSSIPPNTVRPDKRFAEPACKLHTFQRAARTSSPCECREPAPRARRIWRRDASPCEPPVGRPCTARDKSWFPTRFGTFAPARGECIARPPDDRPDTECAA